MGCTMGHAKCSGQITILEGAAFGETCGANLSWHFLILDLVSALMACRMTIRERAPNGIGWYV
jgi:hypothetical protein